MSKKKTSAWSWSGGGSMSARFTAPNSVHSWRNLASLTIRADTPRIQTHSNTTLQSRPGRGSAPAPGAAAGPRFSGLRSAEDAAW